MGDQFAKYAWPGGYPQFAAMWDGGPLCMDCVSKERAQFHHEDKNWRIEGIAINWESPTLYCTHCEKRIESAYAEEEGF